MAVLGIEIAGRYRLDRTARRRRHVDGLPGARPVLERQVAIKLLAEHLAEDDGFVARFRREALAAAKLVHPNIVQVYDSGYDTEAHRHYIVMEYVEGETLAQILRERGRLAVGEAVDIVSQACEGLEYAHRHAVIHRDVKPGNLLINPDGVVKLADFGIAKAAEDSKITQIGSVLGTAAYLSPERARGRRRPSAPTSIRSASCSTSRSPAVCPTRPARSPSWRCASRRASPSRWRWSTPRSAPSSSRAVARSLAADPAERYASARTCATRSRRRCAVATRLPRWRSRPPPRERATRPP